jgi:hypothetical protein
MNLGGVESSFGSSWQTPTCRSFPFRLEFSPTPPTHPPPCVRPWGNVLFSMRPCYLASFASGHPSSTPSFTRELNLDDAMQCVWWLVHCVCLPIHPHTHFPSRASPKISLLCTLKSLLDKHSKSMLLQFSWSAPGFDFIRRVSQESQPNSLQLHTPFAVLSRCGRIMPTAPRSSIHCMRCA